MPVAYRASLTTDLSVLLPCCLVVIFMLPSGYLCHSRSVDDSVFFSLLSALNSSLQLSLSLSLSHTLSLCVCVSVCLSVCVM